MPTIDFYVCSEHKIKACANWIEAAENFPCTGIYIPEQSALTSLAGLLTGTSTYQVTRLDGITEPIYCLNINISKAIDGTSYDEITDVAVKWASQPPWRNVNINPFDLAGFLVDLKSLWCGSREPQKSIFLWFQEET